MTRQTRLRNRSMNVQYFDGRWKPAEGQMSLQIFCPTARLQSRWYKENYPCRKSSHNGVAYRHGSRAPGSNAL